MSYRTIVVLVSAVWVAVTSTAAYHYALHRITSPDATAGYETTWKFQLVMFSIFRLPLFVLGLGTALWLAKVFSKTKPQVQ